MVKDKVDSTIKFVKFAKSPIFKDEEQIISWLKSFLELSQEHNFVVKSRDNSGNANKLHIRLSEYYKNIPIEFCSYIVHTSILNGQYKINSINGSYKIAKNIDVNSRLTEEEAINKAKLIFGEKAEDIRKIEKVIIPIDIAKNEILRLAYKINLFCSKPLKGEDIYIDAITGKFLKKLSTIHYEDIIGNATTQYSGNVLITTDKMPDGKYRLKDNARGVETYNIDYKDDASLAIEIIDDDNNWTNTDDQAAFDAHYNTQKYKDYLLSKFNRNSIDNAGLILKSYIHDPVGANAYWEPDVKAMFYGDGLEKDGKQYPFTSAAVICHEITHGLTRLYSKLNLRK